MESALLMFILVIIILSRFLLWSCFSKYVDYKLAKRYPDRLKND
ncbi:small integral membrane protein 38 [Pelobates fuscus]